MTIFGVIGAVCLLICGGGAAMIYFALRSVAPDAGVAELPARTEVFDSDAAAFNAGLAKQVAGQSADPCVDASLCQFIDQSMRIGFDGGDVPFSRSMFLDAIQNSPRFSGSLGMLDRIQINEWFDLYLPAPDDFDKYHRIVEVDFGVDPTTARVDLLIYSEANQAESQQWFVVKENGGWKVYDWQNLEFGRRMSDEYAAFYQSNLSYVDGYDLAMDELANAQAAWDEGDDTEAFRLMRKVEAMKMMPSDRSVARLRSAYVWLAYGQYQQAADLLNQIPDPQARWGVYPILAICYLNLDDPDRAMEMAMLSQSQTPDHPRSHWLMSLAHDALDQTEQAADAMAKALAGCPQDRTLIDEVLRAQREKDIPVLLSAMEKNQVDAWTTVADSIAYDAEWAALMIDGMSKGTGYPTGVQELMNANQAWANKDFDQAADWFAQAFRTANDPAIRASAASDHIDARIETDDYQALFAEADDLPETLRTLTQWMFGDEFYGDPQKLATAIEGLPEEPDTRTWLMGLAGYCHYESGDYQQAADTLTRFIAAYDAGVAIGPNTVSRNDGEQEVLEDSWLRGQAANVIAESLVMLRKPIDALELFSDEAPVVRRITSDLINQGDRELWQSVLQATESRFPASSASDVPSPAIAMLRVRLQAAVAAAKGDGKRADQLHRQAAELLARGEPDEGSQGLDYVLNWNRAKDLVLNRVTPGDIELADAAAETGLIEAVIGRATAMEDGETLAAWFALSQSAEMSEESRRASAALMAEYHFSQGQYEKVDATIKDDPQQSNLVAQALLEAGMPDAARVALVTGEAEFEDEGDESIAPRALASLAMGDHVELRQEFESFDPSRIGNWLSFSTNRRWLERFSGEDWVIEMLRDYRFPIRYLSPEQSVAVFSPAESLVDGKGFAASLEKRIGGAVTVRQIPVDSSDQSQAWIAETDSGTRVLVMRSVFEYKTDGLPESIHPSMMSPVQRIAICIQDQKPKAKQRLFTIARTLIDGPLGGQAIGLRWEDESLTWLGDDLAEQIQWVDRVPIQRALGDVRLLTKESGDELVVDMKSLDQWQETLDAGGGRADIEVRIQCASIREWIPCELVAIDKQQYDLIVIPKRASQIDPLIVPGIEYSTRAFYVR